MGVSGESVNIAGGTAGPGKASSDVLGGPDEGALERLLVGRLVVGAALVAREAVAGVVDVDLHVGALRLDDLHVRQRNRMVLVAEMQQRRHLRLEVRVL